MPRTTGAVVYKVNELLSADERSFVIDLFKQREPGAQFPENQFSTAYCEQIEHKPYKQRNGKDDDYVNQFRAWLDILFFQNLIQNRSKKWDGDISVSFEYKLINGGLIDALIVTEHRITVLELKAEVMPARRP